MSDQPISPAPTERHTPRTEAGPPTICKCGLARSYHEQPESLPHQYEPRYEPEAWREGYRTALREAATTPLEPEPICDQCRTHGRTCTFRYEAAAAPLEPRCEVRPTGQEWRESCGRPMPCPVHAAPLEPVGEPRQRRYSSDVAQPLDVRDKRFVQAVREVFDAPGEDFGPAKGYYSGDINHFIDMLAARLGAASDQLRERPEAGWSPEEVERQFQLRKAEEDRL